ncbi:MAG TPA: class I SAM-dependent methyltransferase [Gaiellaceae bacterium]
MDDQTQDVNRFYEGFADHYELAYGGNWDGALARQGAALDRLIRSGHPEARDVLDCACGIGTQAIGLAQLGYRVRGTDLSDRAVARARAEAERRGLSIELGVADFRDLRSVPAEYDVVIACDNALPHLLDEADVILALREMHGKLRPGGLLVVTMRDFDAALLDRQPVMPTVVTKGPPRRLLVRLHDWESDRPLYHVRYLVLTEREGGWVLAEHSTRYRAITRAELNRAARAARFEALSWPAEQIVGGQQVMTAVRSA